ncbi:hypothetical protein HNQ07_003952 [Deinococcus metalli]|nr:hypothetical protein [Deinococcus metalli]MBB5378445.1 hypothetical protein [Deinococcus metalli]
MARTERPPPPLELTAEQTARIPQEFYRLTWEPDGAHAGLDGYLTVTWLGNEQRYIYDYTADWSEATFSAALEQMIQRRRAADAESNCPLVILPYLNGQQLHRLAETDVSGLDLAGNCCLHFPHDRLIITGRPVRHQRDYTLKNPYRGISSLVGRMLLIRPQFRTGLELKAAIEQRGGRISQPLVSRVVKELTSQALVGPDSAGHRITLQDPGGLLEQLVEHWKDEPRVLWRGRIPTDSLPQAAQHLFASTAQPVILTGLSSIGAVSSLTTDSSVSLYVDRVANLPELAGAMKTSRFPNLTLYQAPGDEVFFDARPDDAGILHASPIQVYLEARRGDSRLQQGADEVKRRILDSIRTSMASQDTG